MTVSKGSPRRVPSGYTGTNHETIGSDIIAITTAITLSEQVLGREIAASLKAVKPDGWYPIAMLLDALDVVEQKVGRASLTQVGRKLYGLSHSQRVGPAAKSAADLIFGLDGMYHHANRGEGIGGWRVESFAPGKALLRKITPHPCFLEEGILTEAFGLSKLPVFVRQKQCLRDGAECCVFDISSVLHDERWHGGRPYTTTTT